MKPYLIAVIAVALGAALVIAGYRTNEAQLDREMEMTAARHDAERLAETLGRQPGAEALEFAEISRSSRHLSVENMDEAWLTLKQPFITDEAFAAVEKWHAERLTMDGWSRLGEGQFARGQWRVRLEPLPEEASRPGTRYLRFLEWSRDFPQY